MIRAIRYHAFGGPEQLRLDMIEMPQPAPGEVLVRVQVAGVNPVDAKIVAGQFPAAQPPRVPGIDFAGIVEAGEGFEVGTAVFGSGPGFGVVRDGSYADYVTAPALCVVRRPDNLEPAAGAALGVVFITAWLAAMDAAATRAGEIVLVHGAGGGVGQALVQLAARSAHARVIAVVSSSEAAARAAAQGAEIVIDRSREEIPAAVARATEGRGADVIIDVVGGAVFEMSLTLLAPGGRLIAVGVSAGQPGRVGFDLAAFYRGNKRIIGVNSAVVAGEARRRILGELAARLATGEIAPPDVTRLPLEQAADAHRRVLEAEGAHGKIVLEVNG